MRSNGVAWAFAALTVALVAVMIVLPVLRREEQVVAESELWYLGKDAERGEGWYMVLKRETAEWIEILCKASPLVTALSAFALGRKKKK